MPTIAELLESSRRELLDLSNRNRLLSMPVDSSRARIVHVKDELSDNVFKTLVRDKARMGFRPSDDDDLFAGSEQDEDDAEKVEVESPQPDENLNVIQKDSRRHTDRILQTALSSEGLQRRLLALYRDAQTIMEEQGVNILYLALGRLKWFEANNSEIPRYAPLLLIPVQLSRKSGSDRFKLSWREEEVQENLSLREKLKAEHGLTMPPFPDEEDLVPSDYFNKIAQVVAAQPRWEVQPNGISLAFFSFAKFLMYRDLDSRNWPDPNGLLAHPGLTALLRDGFPRSDSPFSEDADLDNLISADRLDHVVDADSSQTIAIEMVRQGRSMVIQGPPGTGKSQSITNLIAAAVLDGKKVLFVAEKLAALEVVKRRLEASGLGALCLELHSNKAHKRAVLAEIERTWQLGRPRGQELEPIVERLEQVRGKLNAHAALMHSRLAPHGLSPFQILGSLSMLEQRGVVAGELDLEHALEWDKATYAERRSLVHDMATQLADMDPPTTHAWRGVKRELVLNIDIPAIKRLLQSTGDALVVLRSSGKQLANVLQQPEPTTFTGIEEQLCVAKHLLVAPHADRQAVVNRVWEAQLLDIEQLVKDGSALIQLKQRYSTVFSEGAFDSDLDSARAIIAQHGTSLFRFFRKDYRTAIASFRSVLVGKPPKEHDARLRLLEDQANGRKLLMAFRLRSDVGRIAFGTKWKALESDWSELQKLVAWIHAGNTAQFAFDYRSALATLDERLQLSQLVANAEAYAQQAREALDSLCAELTIIPEIAFGEAQLKCVPLARVGTVIGKWHNNTEELTRWSQWTFRAHKANDLGLGALVLAIEQGRLDASNLLDAFERSYLSCLYRDAVTQIPELVQFDGLAHDRVLEEFKKVDRDRLALAKYRALAAHHEQIPARHSGVGATGIVMAEVQRQRGQRPIRKLLKDAGSVVQGIKPVFMMSPLSVAQFLEPGAVEFDLLVIDEASQVRPVDSLGAFVRCKQHVVVGDSKQLPPTRFFAKLTSNDDDSSISEDDMPAAQAQDMESILDLCCGRGLQQEMLRWHYRSRHHSLIAVSNHEFYEDKLFIVPSPYSTSRDLGLSFVHVAGATYDRGQTATNRVEAIAICQAVLAHVNETPQLSLGIAAFSVRQQQLILDELELLRKEHPQMEAFFQAKPDEPFFVKNLENVQGDERDVIFISVGYGPDASGFMAMNFGPLSNEGGERRLNVLISRAKKRCQVFASFRSHDIDLQRTQARGVRALKSFLQFAETGTLGLAERTQREHDSPFEEAVARAIQELGYEVHPQVGIAGFFVDLAVVDPQKPGRYLLGIECDGATYHSSRSARDRDRLREAVLTDHGWNIHRIWSTDWFQRRNEQLRKVATALENAKSGFAEPVDARPEVKQPSDIAREEPNASVINPVAALSSPYVEADFSVPWNREPHEISALEMADIVHRIVQLESPIHEDEVVARVRDLWRKERAGSRIRKCVRDGIALALGSKRCVREHECLLIPNQPIPIRNRSNARSASLKKLAFIPRVEMRAAIQAVVGSNHGADPDKLVVTVARMLGFASTSADLAREIRYQIEELKGQGQLIYSDGLLRVAV